MPRPDVSDERIPQILDAAAQMFSEHGIDGASMSQIARSADVSKATIYHYFESKDELVIALARRLFAEDEPTLEKLVAAEGTAPERLQTYAAELVRLLARNADLYPLIAETYAAAMRRPVISDLTRVHFEAYTAAFTQIIEQGQAAGELRADLDAAETALALVALIEGCILIAQNLDQPLDKLMSSSVRVYLDALRP